VQKCFSKFLEKEEKIVSFTDKSSKVFKLISLKRNKNEGRDFRQAYEK
jgi:hypothetical protein